MRTIVSLLIVIASTAVVAQTPVTFTTVSRTRSSVSGVGSSYAPLPDGSVTAVGASLRLLIGNTYPVHWEDIVGLPGRAIPNLAPMAPTGDARRVLVIDHIERPSED